MEKAVRLEVKERTGYHEVVGRVHCRKTRERFELASDKVRRRFEGKSPAIAWAAHVESYAASLGLRRNMRETSLTPDQLREAETAFGLLEGEGARLTDCVRDYLSSGGSVRKYRELSLEALEADYLKTSESVHELSARSLADKQSRLGLFRRETGALRIKDFTVDNVERFLARKKKDKKAKEDKKDKSEKMVSLQTKKNDRAVLHSFGVYLQGKGYIDKNPIAAISAPKPHWKPPAILSPEQAQALMQAALTDERSQGAYVPWYAMCLFAGLRPQADFAKLVIGQNVILQGDASLRQITVFREKRRGVSQRTVPITDNLLKWLQLTEKNGWAIRPPTQKTNDRIRSAAGVLDLWVEDIMRHSYATYQIANGANEGNLSTWIGNSIGVLRRNYTNLVKYRTADAQKYWAIVP